MKKLFLIPLMIILVCTLIFSGCDDTEPTTTTQPTTPAATTPAATSQPTTPSATTPAPTSKPTTPAPTTKPPEPVKPITLKLGYDTPPPTGLGIPSEFFAKEVTARTAGRVTVETYPAGTLSTMDSSLESLRAGIADAYVIGFGPHVDAFPIMNFTSLPGLNFYPDTEELIKTETDTLRAIIDKYSEAQEELEGFRILYSCTYSSTVLMGKGTPIRTPAEMAGKKIGADGLRQDAVTVIGGTPVFTIPPFMYQQLQTGVVDAVLVAWGAALDWQLQELSDYVIDTTFGGSQLPCFINESTFQKLSDQDKQIVLDTAAEAELVNRQFVSGQIPESRQLWADTGIPILKPTLAEQAQWDAKFAVVWDQYIKMNKDEGSQQIDEIFKYWKDAVEDTR